MNKMQLQNCFSWWWKQKVKVGMFKSASGSTQTKKSWPCDRVWEVLTNFESDLCSHRDPALIFLCVWQFEWAWQHPHSSRRLGHVARRSRKESSLQFHWRVVSNMLRAAPWNRLPLTARWLKQEYRMDFEPALQPPLHIPIAFGSVRAKKKQQLQIRAEDEASSCFICKGPVAVVVKDTLVTLLGYFSSWWHDGRKPSWDCFLNVFSLT